MTEGWGDIPTEILLMIMANLDAKELARLGNVNYHWKRVGEDDSLWKYLFHRDFKQKVMTDTKIYGRWIDEYKLLKFESPVVLAENLQDCPTGLSHVAFSNNGKFFCTIANDASFKVWTATSPVYLLDERYMETALGWYRILECNFSPDSERLLLAGTKSDESGEIAVYIIDEENCAIHYTCRVPNNPPDVGSCWYNNSYILSGDIFFFNRNSVVGTSVSQIFICSALPPDSNGSEAVVMSSLYRFLNRGGACCQMIGLSRYVPPRLRGVIILAEEAAVEHKSLSTKVDELVDSSLDEEEKRKQMRLRINEISELWKTDCMNCTDFHHEDLETDNLCSVTYPSSCLCSCHELDHRLLIYALDGTVTTPPRRIAFKIVDGNMIVDKLYPCNSAMKGRGECTAGRRSNAEDEQLSAIFSMVDFPDHIIDMKAFIMGMSLSADQKYLYVNVTHDNFNGDSHYEYLAEIRVINLSTMMFERSYFGHFARFTDRLKCSVGGHYIASASLDGGRIWSREYNCVIGETPHNGGAAAIALNPVDGSMAVSVGLVDGKIKIWQSKMFLQRYIVPNDFM